MTTPHSDESHPPGRRRLIILFTRLPVPGRVKTRLIPVLGAEGAARLQADLIFRTLELLERFSGEGGASLEIHFDGGTGRDARRWFGSTAALRAQSGRDLGERLRISSEESFRRGYREVVIVGADIPRLAREHLEAAFTLLCDHDLVLGPAVDGGYYLVGLSRTVPGIFEGIPWGGAEVLARTIEKAEALDLRIGLLETLGDIDTPDDYRAWATERERRDDS
jgi:rSAM/selenodomain-associated transferase 1